MIPIKPYGLTWHYTTLSKWYKARGLEAPPEDELPKIGVMATDVAVGFLRMVEGGFAQIDGLITNPRASAEDRHLGNNLITTELCAIAEKLGIKAIIANSTDLNTIARAERHGFVVLPHKLFVKKLNNNSKVSE